MAYDETLFNFIVKQRKNGGEYVYSYHKGITLIGWFKTLQVDGKQQDILLIQQETADKYDNGVNIKKDMLTLYKRLRKDGGVFYTGYYEGMQVNGNFWESPKGRFLKITYKNSQQTQQNENNDCPF
jgi:hypothetical protein